MVVYDIFMRGYVNRYMTWDLCGGRSVVLAGVMRWWVLVGILEVPGLVD